MSDENRTHTYTLWTPEEVKKAITMFEKDHTYEEISREIDRSVDSIRSKLKRIRLGKDELSMREVSFDKIPESRFQRYDEPLVMEGDAAVLPDIELPFHNADFFNRVLELVDTWGIKKAIVAGDLLHFDSLSTWEANWVLEGGYGLSEKNERTLMNMAMGLPKKYQHDVIATIVSLDEAQDDMSSGVSRELAAARGSVHVLSELFDEIDFILGNHEDRFLRAMNSPMFPTEILRLIEAGDKWRAKPYYYSILLSNEEKFQIEHPVTWAKSSAYKLASKYGCHILQAHSHRWNKDLDISGRYWAIHMGCIVDEFRLPYASQRHRTVDAHALGAVIVRDGYPYLLSDKTPWEKFKKMK